jgi:hypothetical protein
MNYFKNIFIKITFILFLTSTYQNNLKIQEKII